MHTRKQGASFMVPSFLAHDPSGGLDENLICLKEYIHSSGGPCVRDQELVWSRSELAWIQELETRISDSFSLFYLGITEAWLALSNCWNLSAGDPFLGGLKEGP